MERIVSKKLILEIETNKQTYREEFGSYAELEQYITDNLLCRAEMAEVEELLTGNPT